MECQRGSSLPAGMSWTGQQGGGRHFTLLHPRKMIELVVNSRGALAKCKAISERCVTLSAKQGTGKCIGNVVGVLSRRVLYGAAPKTYMLVCVALEKRRSWSWK